MSAIDQLFTRLRAEGQKAFIPFLTAGDPDLDFTTEAIRRLATRGCSLCEIGIPYSDPIADGPVIQASYTRALARRVKLAQILEAVGKLQLTPNMPLVTMVSYAVVHRHGMESFIDDAQRAGISGAIVPDLLIEEADALATRCRKADFSLIQLVTPTTPPERALRIAEASSGFLYYVSVTGITGERTELPPQLLENVAWLRQRTPLPICIGFGISQPDHVRMLAPVADGIIVGSAFVRRMALVGEQSRERVLDDMSQLATELMAPLRGS